MSDKPTYGLRITVTRSDLPEVELNIDQPGIESALVVDPLIKTLIAKYDEYTASPRFQTIIKRHRISGPRPPAGGRRRGKDHA